MKVEYKYWEKGTGFEEIQAKIYNENNPENQTPITAKDIIERFEREKIDPKTVRYAFAGEDNKPLAYIQARNYPEIKETHLGYPWALSECPEEVQHKLFDEMLSYLQTKDSDLAIRVNVPLSNENIVNFVATKDQLVKIGKSYRRELDVHKLKQQTSSQKGYNIRKASKEDVDILVELIKTDGRYSGQFTGDEDIIKYFSDRVLPDDHCYLAFKDDKLVMASAPLITKLPGDTEERLILRFHSFLPDHEPALEPLLIDIAKECVSTGLDTKPLAFFEGFNESKVFKNIIKNFEPVNSEVLGFTYGLKT